MQQAFARALLDPTQPCPTGLRAWNGSDPSRRFAVYRNNVVTSLVDALAESFPVVPELVGSGFFAAMARVYATRHPPTDPVLARYGGEFPEFIEQFEPAQRVPYLADVARLERLRVLAFHAADAPALSAAHIGRQLSAPQGLGASMPSLHPSVAVLASAYAVVSLWGAHQGAGELSRVDAMHPECALVLRQDDEVLVIGIAPETAAFVRQLQGGATLAEAVSAAAAFGGGFDLSGSLALLIRHGAIVAWHAARRPEP
jgi:hypothetical protein